MPEPTTAVRARSRHLSNSGFSRKCRHCLLASTELSYAADALLHSCIGCPGRRCAQQKATSFELLVGQVQASHQQQLAHMDAVRITREFIEATGIVCGRPQPIFNLAETDIE